MVRKIKTWFEENKSLTNFVVTVAAGVMSTVIANAIISPQEPQPTRDIYFCIFLGNNSPVDNNSCFSIGADLFEDVETDFATGIVLPRAPERTVFPTYPGNRLAPIWQQEYPQQALGDFEALEKELFPDIFTGNLMADLNLEAETEVPTPLLMGPPASALIHSGTLAGKGTSDPMTVITLPGNPFTLSMTIKLGNSDYPRWDVTLSDYASGVQGLHGQADEVAGSDFVELVGPILNGATYDFSGLVANEWDINDAPSTDAVGDQNGGQQPGGESRVLFEDSVDSTDSRASNGLPDDDNSELGLSGSTAQEAAAEDNHHSAPSAHSDSSATTSEPTGATQWHWPEENDQAEPMNNENTESTNDAPESIPEPSTVLALLLLPGYLMTKRLFLRK